MKFVNTILACGVAMMVTAIAADLQAQGMQPSKAKVRTVVGDAQYKANAAADWAPIKAGAVLNPGAIIETGKGATVDLYLVDIGVLKVTEVTTLVIDKLALSKLGNETVVETELNLKAGTIMGNVKKLAAASRYDVKVPNGVCGIRGTEFKVSASGVLQVVTGTVRVTYTPQGGQAIVRDVQAGQVFIPPAAVGEQPIVRAIDLADPVWKEVKDMGSATPPAGMEVQPLPPSDPVEKPADQPGHPTGAPQ